MENIDNTNVRCISIEFNHYQSPCCKKSNLNTKDRKCFEVVYTNKQPGKKNRVLGLLNSSLEAEINRFGDEHMSIAHV